MKQCNRCGATKPLSEFHRNAARSDGHIGRCKSCANTDKKARRDEVMARRKVDPEFDAAQRQAHRAYKRNWLYSAPMGTIEKIELDQAGKCAACGKSPFERGSARRLHVDHDHITGKIRGLLCHGCNTALGLLNDDIDLIMALAAYRLQSSNLIALER